MSDAPAPTRRMNMIEAINDAMRIAMARDDNVVVFGEDVGYFGGVFRATAGLQQEFGKTRSFDTPITECGIIGVAVGMAAYGLRPVPEIQFADYIYPALDQLVSEAARIRYRSAGQWQMPITVRSPFGGGIFEPKRIYNGPFDGHYDRPVQPWAKHPASEVPEGHYTLPLGRAALVREGQDLTVITYGTMVHVGLAAVEELDAVNNPEDASAGTRKIPFSKTLYIEQDDFREVPPPKYYRLSPGKEVRLRYGYIIKCESVVKDAEGNVVEVHCTYDPDSRSGGPTSNRKVKATIHWVSAAHAVDAEVRNYDTLFTKENPDDVEEGQDFTANLNPNSLEVLHAKVEPSLKDATSGARYQFERMGYFCVDPDSVPGKPVFNKTIGLKDTWAKIEQREKN